MDGFVTLKDVKKIYQMGEVQIMAAAGIDFQIQKGEFAVVVGPAALERLRCSISWAEWIRPLPDRCWWMEKISPPILKEG